MPSGMLRREGSCRSASWIKRGLASSTGPSLFPGGAHANSACHPRGVTLSRGPWDDVIRWCERASDLPVFVDGLLVRLGAVVGFDGAFLAVVDPATLLYTQAYRRGMP